MDFSTRFGAKVARCEAILGYTFKSKPLCAEALNAAGDANATYELDGVFTCMPKNDRLAVYGDIVASHHLCTFWLATSSEKRVWTTMRNKLLGNANLYRICETHGIEELVNANGGTSEISASMLATTLEALFGAVHRDGGSEALAGVMERLGISGHHLLPSAAPLRAIPPSPLPASPAKARPGSTNFCRSSSTWASRRGQPVPFHRHFRLFSRFGLPLRRAFRV